MTLYHKHHIIPKHMGGTDDPSNKLTVEEHAETTEFCMKIWTLARQTCLEGVIGRIEKEEIISILRMVKILKVDGEARKPNGK